MAFRPGWRLHFFTHFKYLTALPLLFLLAGCTADGKLDLPRAKQAETRQFAQNLAVSAQTMTDGNVAKAALQATESAIDYWLPALGEGAPDWVSRFEFEWDIQENDKPEYSLLTVQPLYQTDSKQDTIFTQLRVASDYTFGTHRATTNAGLGYRRLVADNTILLGVNTFFDHEWRFNHSRVGFGGEARVSGFDLYVNYYEAISDRRSVSSGVFEQALDGLDVELTGQIPYLPWARARGQYFKWDTETLSDNIDGYTGSVELDLHQNIQLETGFTDDNFNDGFWFAKIRIIPGNRKRPVMASSRMVADQAFEWRDMRGHTLDKVRRVNNIVVERTSSGVTISRLN